VASASGRPITSNQETHVTNFKTYRVRYTEWQAFAINLSARSAEEACELARKVRGNIGQEPFEEFDGAIEHFEAKELDAHDAIGSNPPQTAKSALHFLKERGGAS
jgi:hypothetical protein